MGPYNGVVEFIGSMGSCITLDSMMVRPSSAVNGESRNERSEAEPHTQFTKTHVEIRAPDKQYIR